MVKNWVLYVFLRLASLLVPLVPPRLALRAASLLGLCAYYLLRGPREGISANLSRVLASPPDSREVRRKARVAFQNDAKNWVDTLRIAQLTDHQIVHALQVEGWEHLEAAAAKGHGVILVGMHLGNFDLVGQLLAIRGYKLTVPVERMQLRRLFDLLLKLRTSKGINVIPADQAPRQLLQRLKTGEIVGLVGDRTIVGRGVPVEFFGDQAVLPRGPLSLARHAQAPVLLGVGVRLPSDKFQGFITPVIPMNRSEDAPGDERENARRITSLMEDFVRRFPEQWLVFTPIWNETAGHQVAGRIKNPNEAAVG